MTFSLFRSLVLALACGGTLVYADAVNVDIYSGYQPVGGGAPFTGLVGSFTSPDIEFGTDTDWQWAPYGLDYFGAEVTGTLDASAAGVYRIAMTSDDGSLLFIDGTEILNDGGLHGAGLVFTDLALTAGLHPFEIQYFQGACCQAGLDLSLPADLTYADIPEPGTLLLLFTGLIGIWVRFAIFRSPRLLPRVKAGERARISGTSAYNGAQPQPPQTESAN